MGAASGVDRVCAGESSSPSRPPLSAEAGETEEEDELVGDGVREGASTGLSGVCSALGSTK